MGNEKGSFAGRRVVVTEPLGSAENLREGLREIGVEVIDFPTLRIEAPTDLRAFAELVQDAHAYDWIIFTSAEGVSAFFDLFYKLYDDVREIGGAKFAVVGQETARRLKGFHLRIELEVKEDAVELLPRKFKEIGGVENLRLLLVQEEEARDVLSKEFSAMGGIVDEGFAYRIRPATRDDDVGRRRFLEEGADLITFISTQAIESFFALGLPWPNESKLASLGPDISEKARAQGLRVDLEARRSEVPSLLEVIRKFYQRSP